MVNDKKELPGRLSRWSLIISEFTGMEIIHRPGRKMEDVDFLSRHPVDAAPREEIEIFDKLVMSVNDPTLALTHEEYVDEQRRDSRINEIIETLERDGANDKHVIVDGVLYKKDRDKTLIEVPECLIRNILYMHHDHQTAGH